MTNNLQSILDKKGITQYKFAKMIGKPHSQVSDWCRNKKLIGIIWAYRIKAALKLKSIEDIYKK